MSVGLNRLAAGACLPIGGQEHDGVMAEFFEFPWERLDHVGQPTGLGEGNDFTAGKENIHRSRLRTAKDVDHLRSIVATERPAVRATLPQHTTAATAHHRHGLARSMHVVPELCVTSSNVGKSGRGRASQSQAGTGFRAQVGKSVGLFPVLRPGQPVGSPAHPVTTRCHSTNKSYRVGPASGWSRLSGRQRAG